MEGRSVWSSLAQANDDFRDTMDRDRCGSLFDWVGGAGAVPLKPSKLSICFNCYPDDVAGQDFAPIISYTIECWVDTDQPIHRYLS